MRRFTGDVISKPKMTHHEVAVPSIITLSETDQLRHQCATATVPIDDVIFGIDITTRKASCRRVGFVHLRLEKCPRHAGCDHVCFDRLPEARAEIVFVQKFAQVIYEKSVGSVLVMAIGSSPENELTVLVFAFHRFHYSLKHGYRRESVHVAVERTHNV